MDIKAAQAKVAAFAEERAWNMNTPSQRVVHLTREVGKLGEHILFIEGMTAKSPAADYEKQVGDVFFSLIQLANRLDIDLEQQLQRAMEKDAAKYPAAETKAESLRAYSKIRSFLAELS